MKNLHSKSIKIMLYTFFIFISEMVPAQKKVNQQFAICNDIVGTMKMFNHYKSQIEKTTFFKNKAGLPSSLKKFEFLADNGLTEIELKKNAGTPDIISLEILNEQFGLPKNSPILIDGCQFDDPLTNIFSEIIVNGKVIDSNGNKVLYIITAGS